VGIEIAGESRKPASIGFERGRVGLVQQVTEAVREDILDGRLQPGARVQIRELTDRFGVSHIPVREALRTLETEGLLVSSPTKATFVSELELEDLASLYDMRRLVECPLSRMAAPGLTDLQVARVFELLSAMDGLELSSREFRQVHKAFHRALLASVTDHWTDEVLDMFWRGSERYIRVFIRGFGPAVVQAGMAVHREMAQAAAARDGERLEELHRKHLTNTQRTIEDGYASQGRQTRGTSAEEEPAVVRS
jgi:DNA-binding GntR family transcriptional regulator